MTGCWRTETIGSVCEVVNGATPKTTVGSYWGGEHRWITPAEMGGRTDPFVRDTARTLTLDGLASCAARLLPPNSVILSSRAPIGHVAINTEPMATNQGCKGLIPQSRVNAKYLYYYLVSARDLLDSLGVGATFRELSGTRLKGVPLPLPPMPEQQRIVAILDEALEGIATARANAEKNLQSSRAILVDRLRFLFSAGAEGWEPTTVGDQVTLQRGFDITKSQQKPGQVPVVSSGGVRSFHDAAMAPGPGVVIGRKGTLGKVFYLESEYWPHDTTLWVKDFKGNHPRLVYYFFMSLDVKGLDSGTANPALNRNQVHPIQTMWPAIDRQDAIAAKLDALNVNSHRLAESYRRKLAALDELKKSLLHEAFSGNL